MYVHHLGKNSGHQKRVYGSQSEWMTLGGTLKNGWSMLTVSSGPVFHPKYEKIQLYLPLIIMINHWILIATGTPFRRYSSFTEPQNMEQDIKFLLGEVPHPSFDGNAIEYYNSRMPKDLD